MLLLTMAEAAAKLRMSQATVVRMADANKITAIRPNGPTGHRRIVASSIDRHLESLVPSIPTPERFPVIQYEPDTLSDVLQRCKNGNAVHGRRTS